MHNYPLLEENKKHLIKKEYPIVIAGPCSVENLKDMEEYCKLLLKHNVHYIRAALFKPRTSPHDFQGLMQDGIEILKTLKEKFNIKLVSEITYADQLPLLLPYIDVIQIGARNMQNYELLKAIGKTDKTILLKRGFSATIDEWLGAAEYILEAGNNDIILCERGIRTFETSLRNTLDLASAIYVKQLTNLPVIIDPSHATGKKELIEPLSMASIASGLDGFMIEIHKNPEIAYSDGMQSITLESFEQLMEKLKKYI